MPLDSIFGSVSIGKDTSGSFRLSPYGLAVRSSTDGKFIARHRDELIDVTDLTFEGSENLVYRIPKKTPAASDIIIRSDNPLSVLFVDSVDNDDIVVGTDPAGDIHEIRPVTNVLTQVLTERRNRLHFFVVAAGLDSFMEGGRDNGLLTLLLLGGQGTGADASADPLKTILLLKTLGAKDLDDKALALLMLSRGSAATGTNDPLLMMLALGGSGLFERETDSREGEPRERAPTERDPKKPPE